MTDDAGATARVPRAVAARTPGRRKRHAAAASRVLVGGAALAGTFNLAAVMAAEPSVSFEAATAAPPTTVAPTTSAPAPTPAPRTVVVVRRHVITGDGSSVVRQSSAPAVRSASPAPAPAPAPAANTQTKGS